MTQRIQDCSPRHLGLSSIVVAELRYGADKSALRLRNHSHIDILVQDIPTFDFDLATAQTFGRIRAGLEGRGETIGPYDMMIGVRQVCDVVGDSGCGSGRRCTDEGTAGRHEAVDGIFGRGRTKCVAPISRTLSRHFKSAQALR